MAEQSGDRGGQGCMEMGKKVLQLNSIRVLLRLQHQQPGEINKAKKVPETAWGWR